jgi:hypothetical protein
LGGLPLSGRRFVPGNPDHFSERFEPERRAGKRNNGSKRPIVGKKLQENCESGEQYGAVAPRSQLRTIHAPALPRSNQIEATLFD